MPKPSPLPPLSAPPDQVADGAARAEKARKREERLARDRERKRREYAAKKAQRMGRPRKPDPVPGEGELPEDEVNGAQSPLVDPAPPPPKSEAPPPPEFLQDPQKLAAFLAKTQMMLRERVQLGKRERIARVVEALGWADEKGAPTDQCQLGVSLSWQWLQEGGLDFLMTLSPSVLAIAGGAILLGPALITAYDEYQDHRAQRTAAAAKVVPIKAAPEPGAAGAS